MGDTDNHGNSVDINRLLIDNQNTTLRGMVAALPFEMRVSEIFPPRPLRILLVDDDVAEAPLLRVAVRELNLSCEIDAICDSEQLIACLQDRNRQMPDLILLDINMPKLDGYAVLTKLREHKALHLLPVIMFSTISNAALVTRAYDLGANAFVVKPMGSYNDLVRRIHSFWFHHATLPIIAGAIAA